MIALVFGAITALTAVAPIGHLKHGYAGVNCTRCHFAFTAEDDRSALHLPPNEACTTANCHPTAPPTCTTPDCASCHMDDDERSSLLAMRNALVFNHNNHLPRTKGDCMVCHPGAVKAEASGRGALPVMEDCRSCHARWLDEMNCLACHVSLADFPVMPITMVQHRPGFFAEHGRQAERKGDICAQCHGQTYCRECHDRRSPLPPDYVFPDRPDRAQIHRMGWRNTHATDARLWPTSCVGCHASTDCVDCHRKSGFRAPSGPAEVSSTRMPHPPDYGQTNPARDARRDLLACASCHSGSGPDVCVTCHAVGRPGGSPHGGRYPVGNTGKRPCRQCHSRVR